MDYTLIVSALLMGLAGSVHCLAMCGAASAAAVRVCSSRPGMGTWTGFHLGRILGYGLAGAVAASSVGALAALGQWSPALRPLWTLAHLAALGLGLWLMIRGQQPVWLEQLGRSGRRGEGSVQPVVLHPRRGWVKAVGLGSLWFAWPCGLLQSALLVASLANSAAAGATVMVVFAAASAVALGVGPALWAGWLARDPARQARLTRVVIRLSGATLAGASLWALGHDLFVRFAAWCLS